MSLSRSRRTVLQALAAGWFAPGLAEAGLFGSVPARVPAGRSVHTVRGEARQNGRLIDRATFIGPDAQIETGPDAELAFVVGRAAYLMRGAGRVKFEQDGSGLPVVRLDHGRLLSVFGQDRLHIRMPVAVVAIRGTGVYAAVEADGDYVCTCYGTTEIAARDDPTSREAITSTHHDAPRFVQADGAPGRRVIAAPFKDHTDEELVLIESLVGRMPPFPISSGGQYTRPPQDY